MRQPYVREYAKIKKLYKQAFPFKERKPFFLLKWQQRRGAGRFFAITGASDELAGFAFTVSYKNSVLLDYLAIDPRRRGMGFGGKALSELKDAYSDKILVCEVEDPRDPDCANVSQREKRLNFYAANGFIQLQKLRVYGTGMLLLSSRGKVTFEEYGELIRRTNGRLILRLMNPKRTD